MDRTRGCIRVSVMGMIVCEVEIICIVLFSDAGNAEADASWVCLPPLQILHHSQVMEKRIESVGSKLIALLALCLPPVF